MPPNQEDGFRAKPATTIDASSTAACWTEHAAPYCRRQNIPGLCQRIRYGKRSYGYTINNARGMGIDDITGSLQAGKYANLLILPGNIFEMTSDEIGTIIPDVYMFEGQIIETRDFREDE